MTESETAQTKQRYLNAMAILKQILKGTFKIYFINDHHFGGNDSPHATTMRN